MNNNKFKILNYIVKKEFIKHSQIIPLLNKANYQEIDPDNVAELVKQCKFRSKTSSYKIINFFKSIIKRIFSIAFALIFAVVFGEFSAVKAFSDTIIAKELTGFPDQFLYWLGLKSINVTGPEMMGAFAKVIESTPKIVEGMFIGAITGFVTYEIIAFLIILIIRKAITTHKINNFIKTNSK